MGPATATAHPASSETAAATTRRIRPGWCPRERAPSSPSPSAASGRALQNAVSSPSAIRGRRGSRSESSTPHERADRPVAVGVESGLRTQQDVRGESVEGGAERRSGQDETQRGSAAASGRGEQQDGRARDHPSGQGPHQQRGGRVRTEEGEPQHHGEGGARVDAEQSRLGEGVAGGGLQEASRRSQTRPDQDRGKRARQAYVHDGQAQLRVRPGGRIADEVVPGASRRTRPGADEQRQQDEDGQQEHETGGRPHGRASLPRQGFGGAGLGFGPSPLRDRHMVSLT